MKKYVKPELFFESFELSQQIAACDFDSNNTLNAENCVFSGTDDFLGPINIFVTNKGCEWIPEEYCYHNDVGSGYNLFNS